MKTQPEIFDHSKHFEHQASRSDLLALLRASPFGTLICLMFAIVFVGCQKTPEVTESVGSSGQQMFDTKTAEQIMSLVRTTYANANRYADNATLHLSYRLDGVIMEEYHPWDVSFERPRKIAAKLFNSRIRSDGSLLTSFIYDFPSGNLDNQYMVLDSSKKLPFNHLLTDSIARHFVSGQNELPINGNRRLAFEAFVPPTIGLLCNEPDLRWFHSAQIKRLPDVILGERPYYQVELDVDGLLFAVIVDPQSGLIVYVDLPVQLLDEELQQSPQVSELRLFARFSQATLSPTFDSMTFEPVVPDGSNVVTRFVAIPEKFPCDSIGKPISGISFKDLGGFDVRTNQLKGDINVLFWMDETTCREYRDDLLKLASALVPEHAQLTIVLFGDLTDNSNIAPLLGSGFNVLSDKQFEVGTKIGLRTTPAAIILDRNTTVEFTQSIAKGTDWSQSLTAAVHRVRHGDSISKEMREQYSMFLDQYRQRLVESSPVQNASHLQDRSKQFFQCQQLWQLTDINMPGNVVRLVNHDRLLVNEGFRTATLIDFNGEVVSRVQIPTEPQNAMTISKVNPAPDGKFVYAMYSLLSPQLIVLSESFEKIMAIPARDDQTKIVAATWIVFSERPIRFGIGLALHDRPEILYGVLDGSALKSVQLTQPCKSIACIKSNSGHLKLIACLQDGSLAIANCDSHGPVNLESIELLDHSAESVIARSCEDRTPTELNEEYGESSAQSAGKSGELTHFLTLGVGPAGNWLASGFDYEQARRWRIPIPPQEHQNHFKAVAHCPSGQLQGGVWAVAGSDMTVSLISDDGRFVDSVEVGFVITGIELVQYNGQMLLIVCGDQGVIAWSIKLPRHIATFDDSGQRRNN